MFESNHEIEKSRFNPTSVEDYEFVIGAETVSRILALAGRLHDLQLLNINSAHYGGGRPN
jgi:hypothetical protein